MSKQVLANWDVGVNFWTVNPEFKALKVFRAIYDKDKSKERVASSNLMWALAFLNERDNNRFIKYPLEERKQIIAEDVLEDSKFDWGKYASIMQFYNDNCLTSIDRTINSLEDKLDERNTFLIDTKYSLQTAKILDEVFVATSKMQALLEEMRAKRDKDFGVDEQTKGGFTESASERGLI